MKVEFVNPFIEAACEVLESELGGEAQRGEVRLQKSAITTDEVTALVGRERYERRRCDNHWGRHDHADPAGGQDRRSVVPRRRGHLPRSARP